MFFNAKGRIVEPDYTGVPIPLSQWCILHIPLLPQNL